MSKVQSFYFCFYFVWRFLRPSSAPQKAKRNKKMCSNLQCSLCSQFTVTAINLLTTVHPIWCRSLSLLLSAFLFALDALTPLPTPSVTLDLSHSCTLHSALSPACSSIFRQFIRIVKGEQSKSSVGEGGRKSAEQSRAGCTARG